MDSDDDDEEEELFDMDALQKKRNAPVINVNKTYM
jgi:hypothetical protein